MKTSLKGQALSAAMVRTVKAPGQYADLNGLNPRVADSGAKHWIQRVTIAGKRRNIGLGGYPAVSLAEAREVAAANLRVIQEGRETSGGRGTAQATHSHFRPCGPVGDRPAPPDVEQRQARGPMGEYPRNLRPPDARQEVGVRRYQRRCADDPNTNLDHQIGDGQPCPSTH